MNTLRSKSLMLTPRADDDAASADYRVVTRCGGEMVGFACDLAQDEDGTPGSRGFDLFTTSGSYLFHVDELPVAGLRCICGQYFVSSPELDDHILAELTCTDEVHYQATGA